MSQTGSLSLSVCYNCTAAPKVLGEVEYSTLDTAVPPPRLPFGSQSKEKGGLRRGSEARNSSPLERNSTNTFSRCKMVSIWRGFGVALLVAGGAAGCRLIDILQQVFRAGCRYHTHTHHLVRYAGGRALEDSSEGLRLFPACTTSPHQTKKRSLTELRLLGAAEMVASFVHNSSTSLHIPSSAPAFVVIIQHTRRHTLSQVTSPNRGWVETPRCRFCRGKGAR